MKVLHLSNTPLSNSPHNLVTCLNHFLGEGTADLLFHRMQNTNKTFVGLGDSWTEQDPDEIAHRLESADVIHFHNFARSQVLFQQHPEFWDLIAKKPKLIQYHSPRHTTENFEDTLADKSLKHAVVAQYHVRQYPECEFIVPNVIPLFLPRYQGIASKWELNGQAPLVSYSPSNTTMQGWDDKGYEVTRHAIKSLEREGCCTTEIMTHTPYLECMKKKRWAHVGIDEVMTGSYHLSSLEYLSMGCVTVGFLDTQTQNALKHVVTACKGENAGAAALQTLPWVQVHQPQDLRNELYCRLVAQDEAGRYTRWGSLRQKALEGREWLEKYWNPADHVIHFKKIYDSL